MGLTPSTSTSERVTLKTESAPSKTYEFDFDSGDFTGNKIDNDASIRQFIRKALATPRYRHLIYSFNYGHELEDIIELNLDIDVLNVEIPRMIREALLYDDRIIDVTDFEITRESDYLYVNFRVITRSGTVINEEVTL